MKTTTVLTTTFILAATTLFASFILPPYDKSKPPGMSLPAAYQCAVNALGSETNDFHCVSAVITTTFTAEGEWYFTFCSTNKTATPKLVAVEFNGKVVFDNGLR